ncbi:hypothetical protein EMIT0111MI5_30562 [Burkholderia sp. IT-111MI5]
MRRAVGGRSQFSVAGVAGCAEVLGADPSRVEFPGARRACIGIVSSSAIKTKNPRGHALSRVFENARNAEKPHHLVPTARLELAQLSPLPPQDSVSTNFTTSALHCKGRNSSVTLRVCEGGMTRLRCARKRSR